MNKKYLLINIFVGFFLAVSASAAACQDHNVWGYAWSENIGWISMSCKNCDSDFNGYIDVACGSDNATIPSVDYGVDIDDGDNANGMECNNVVGEMCGHAWAENIGWVSFNSADLIGCPSGICEAKVDFGTKKVSGWARALNYGNGWDGWIKLRNDFGESISYGVSMSQVLNPNEFYGYAWGDDVAGWVSFNWKNCDIDGNGYIDVACGGTNDWSGGPSGIVKSNYKVQTSFSSNRAPSAVMSCDNSGCSGSQCNGTWSTYRPTADPSPCIYVIKNDSTDPDGVGDIVNSEWYIKGDSFGSSYVSLPGCGTCAGLCNCTIQSSVLAGNYTIKLLVRDSVGAISETEHAFAVKGEITAGFMCSLNNSDWRNCESFSGEASQGQSVYFKDDLSLTEYSIASEGAVIVFREWKINGIVFDGGSANPSTGLTQSSNIVRLTVTDSAGRSDYREHTIGATPPLPKWKEIPPIIWLKKSLAFIGNFFRF